MRNSITIQRTDQEPLEVIRGKIYSVFFGNNKSENMRVVGISHANRQVSMKHDNAVNEDGLWMDLGCIYPAIIAKQVVKVPKIRPKKLSYIVDYINANNEPPGGFSESDKVLL